MPRYIKPSNNDFRRIFNEVASQYDHFSSPRSVAKRKEILTDWAKGKCLEVGAGTGEISLALKQNGHKVIATDISPKMVKEIKKKGIEALVCDAEKLPFKNNSFDTVIAAELIYYLDNSEAFLNEAYRVLKPGGMILISSANEEMKILDRMRTILRNLGLSKTYFDDPIKNFITPRKLKELLINGKFKRVKIKKIFLGMFILSKAYKQK